ncbi:unnamed protein product [Ectocarpus sp. 12 AP-2014]
MVAREPGTNPAKAIDYCSSAAMARALIKICGDVSCFSLYEQECFVKGERLHDYIKGADRFRRRDVVYEVLCERIMYGGDVLPPHVAKWFNNCGNNIHHVYMARCGSFHMMSCYKLYEKQALEATHELITPAAYQFMVAYHRYTKFLPLTMFFRAVFEKKASIEAIVKDWLGKGFSLEQIQGALSGEDDAQQTNLRTSAEGKKKKRQFVRASKSDAVKELWVLAHSICKLQACEKLILSFL